MIRYQLVCDSAHDFDGWFRGSDAFDALLEAGHVTCPNCGSTDVRKALMAPNVSVLTRAKGHAASLPAPSELLESGGDSEPSGSVPATLNDSPAASLGFMPDATQMDALRKLRDHIKSNAENVGPRFAEEARKMHHEEIEPRGIYGEATVNEAQELLEEGIDVCPLPSLPEDNN